MPYLSLTVDSLSSRRRSAAVLAILLVILALSPARVEAQPYFAELLEAQALSTDLEVWVLWLAAAPDGSELVARHEDGSKVLSVPVNAIDIQQDESENLGAAMAPTAISKPAVAPSKADLGSAVEPLAVSYVLPGVLGLTDQTHLNLTVEDGQGNKLSPVLPIIVGLVTGLGGCDKEVHSGIDTNAVLISEALSEVLDTYPYDDLLQDLQDIGSSHPELSCDIDNLKAHLLRLSSQINELDANPDGKLACTYFWQAMLSGNLENQPIYRGPYRPSPGIVHDIAPGFAEVGGFEARSSHCVTARAQGSADSADSDGQIFYESESANLQLNVHFATRRWTGSQDTCGACAGSVLYGAAYSAQTLALLDQTFGTGTASASATQTVTFSTDAGLISSATVTAEVNSTPPLGDYDYELSTKATRAPAVPQPAQGTLAVTATTSASSSSLAVAKAEVRLDYFWLIKAEASCAALPVVDLTMKSVPIQYQGAIDPAGGGTRIKLQRYP